nr:type VII secretion protein EccB [Fodinicola feengrottensis]
MAGLGLIISPVFAPLSIWMARMPLPVLPRTAGDLLNDDPLPPRSSVYASVLRADSLLTGLVWALAATAVIGNVLLVVQGGTAGVVLSGVLSIGFLLRARLYPIVRQRSALLAAGLGCLACSTSWMLVATRAYLLAIDVPILILLAVVVGLVARWHSTHARRARICRGRPRSSRSSWCSRSYRSAAGSLACTGCCADWRVDMASKRDQLQAHQFQIQRAVSALVLQESDPEHPPFRRVGGAAVAGLVLGVLSLVAAGVFGLIFPGGNSSWKDGNSVIVEKETGTRYVYLNGELHPMINYSSALLALGKHAETASVSHNSLVGFTRGPQIGIPDAPDALPGPDRVVGDWTLCSEPTTTTATGAATVSSVLLVGAPPASGFPTGQRSILVRAAGNGTEYLIYQGYRHLIDSPETVNVGLAVGSVQVATVSPALVESLPQGDPIAPIAVADAGKASTAVPGRSDIRSGALLTMQTPGGGAQHYLASTTQLQPISELAYDIQLAYPPTAKAYQGDPFGMALSPNIASGARMATPTAVTESSAPSVRPDFVSIADQTTVCLGFASGSFVPDVSVADVLPAPDRQIATAGRTPGRRRSRRLCVRAAGPDRGRRGDAQPYRPRRHPRRRHRPWHRLSAGQPGRARLAGLRRCDAGQGAGSPDGPAAAGARTVAGRRDAARMTHLRPGNRRRAGCDLIALDSFSSSTVFDSQLRKG